MLVQRQEAEQELNQKVQKLTGDRTALSDRVTTLQRQLSNMESEQKEVSRSARSLEKDKTALKRTLDKVGGGCVLSILEVLLVSGTSLLSRVLNTYDTKHIILPISTLEKTKISLIHLPLI